MSREVSWNHDFDSPYVSVTSSDSFQAEASDSSPQKLVSHIMNNSIRCIKVS